MYSDAPVSEDAGSLLSLESQEQKPHGNQGSRLLQLPPELLLHVLLYLPHSSLYMVDKTCRVLRNLTDDSEFDSFHREILWHTNFSFPCLSEPEFDQFCIIKQIFQRESLCKPCGNLLGSGELEKRLWTLWQPVYCTGCKKTHPAFLFPQGQRGGNVCVGIIGHFAPCRHVKISGRLQSSVPNRDSVTCWLPEHFPANSEISAFKRFAPDVCAGSGRGRANFEYKRAIPLVKIHEGQFPGMQALKSYLLKQLEELCGDGLCQHASSQFGSIVACLISDKCNCFPTSGIPVHKSDLRDGLQVWCDNHGYTCRLCAARYFWGYEKGYMFLFVRIDTSKWGPDNSVWLANLTFDTDEHPIFNDNTKGVLWCNDPSCGTGCGKRWLMMTYMLKSFEQWIGHFPYRSLIRPSWMPMTLEYRIYRDAANWLGCSGMPRDIEQILKTVDLLRF